MVDVICMVGGQGGGVVVVVSEWVVLLSNSNRTFSFYFSSIVFLRAATLPLLRQGSLPTEYARVEKEYGE